MPKKDKKPIKITTIKLSHTTKERLEKLRVYRRETYEEILEKMLSTLNLLRQNPEQARSKILSLDRQNRKFNVK
jgi:hypothetical protein